MVSHHITTHKDSVNLVLIIVIGIVLLVSLFLVKPISNNVTIGNIGLPLNAVEELKKLLNP